MGADEEAVVKFLLAETTANGKSGKVIGAMQFSRPQGDCPLRRPTKFCRSTLQII